MTKLSARPSPTAKLLTRLIELPDLDRVVRELPSEQFTALVREVGVEDAGELVALATTEQLVAAFDEDLFVGSRPGQREVFDRRRFVTWLEVLLEAGDQAVARRMAELSEDFVAHALSSLVLVLDHDQLRERITSDDPDAEAADAALERALNEEIDGYLLVAREDEGWDAALALVLALDRRDRALLVRILDRCAMLASSYIDDLDALTELLSEAESLAEDVEAAREDRRAKLGHVEPRAAEGFLKLARMPLSGALDQQARDATTRAYLRELERPGAGQGSASKRTTSKLDRLLAELPSASSASVPEHQPPSLTLALQDLATSAPPHFHERLTELAYLSNVVLAAVADEHGQRLRPSDAAQAAMATVALGAELQARERRGGGGRATADELRDVLDTVPADLLFRKACGSLVDCQLAPHDDGLLRSRTELDQVLAALDAPALPPGPARAKHGSTGKRRSPRATTRT